MFSKADRFYGYFLNELLARDSSGLRISEHRIAQQRFYIVNDQIPIFVKYSSSPGKLWTFSFSHQQQVIQRELYHHKGFCITAFVCGADGIAALRYNELRRVLDDYFEPVENVIIRREPNHSYDVRGHDGHLTERVPRNSLDRALGNSLLEMKPPRMRMALQA